jgi:phytoene dehydrogenase-like protein
MSSRIPICVEVAITYSLGSNVATKLCRALRSEGKRFRDLLLLCTAKTPRSIAQLNRIRRPLQPGPVATAQRTVPRTLPPMPPAFAAPALLPRTARTLPLLTTRRCRRHPSATAAPESPRTYDVVVIGSGLGGLTCAALLSAAYAKSVCVLEAHTLAGGAAHAFTRRVPNRPDLAPLTFDSGPHLHSGLRRTRTTSNPLAHALRAVGARVPVVTYRAWGCFFPEGYFATRVSADSPLFSALVAAAAGPAAAAQIAGLVSAMRPLCAGATALPPAALRGGDAGGSARVGLAALRARARARGLGVVDGVRAVAASPRLMQPFRPLLDEYVTDPFANRFVDLLCFLLAGVRADKIPVAEVAFMFDEWTGDVGGDEVDVLEHPVGGSAALVAALVEAVERGGERSVVRTGARVERLLFEEDANCKSGRRAVGVLLAGGERVLARQAVVSNVSAWVRHDVVLLRLNIKKQLRS